MNQLEMLPLAKDVPEKRACDICGEGTAYLQFDSLFSDYLYSCDTCGSDFWDANLMNYHKKFIAK